MKIIKSISQMQKAASKWFCSGKTIGFVPTMGALHAGHISLIKKARAENDKVVVSIFVNPAQFGPGEDFNKYPRTFDADIENCKAQKVNIIFNPEIKDVYPEGYLTYVEVEKLSNLMCGAYRLGHFKGVATIVFKFFNIVFPTVAYFGQKDYQQYIIIKKMCKDLNFNTKLKVLPIIRDENGLALSSRNSYLSEKERKDATYLNKALEVARGIINSGEKDVSKIKGAIKDFILANTSIKMENIEYITVCQAETLESLTKISGDIAIALAVWVGTTRLIDNILIGIKNGS